MSAPLLLEFYDRLPPLRPGDDEDLWAAGAGGPLRDFREAIRQRYTEGTLQRLAASDAVSVRRAAVLGLGLVGTMASNEAVAARLRDDDPLVRRFAADGLWEVWFRGGTPEQNDALQAAGREADPRKARAALDALVREAPDFAEARNRRAIWFFERGEYARSAEDCEAVLRLNPFHFGAAAGMGQCYLKLKKPRAALRAFRQALDIYPDLDDVAEAVRALEAALGNGPREGD